MTCRRSSVTCVYEIRRSLDKLSNHANSLKLTLGSILFVQSLFTTPIACLDLFICLFTDNIVFRYGLPVIAIAVIAIPIALQALAASITSTSEQVHQQLALWPDKLRMPLAERLLLLNMMQETGCKDQPLALYDVLRQKYTATAFIQNVLETIVQLSLLISFSSFLLTYKK